MTPTRVHGGVDRQGVGTLCYPSHSLTLSSMFIIRQTPSVTFQSRLPFAHSSHVVTLRVYPTGSMDRVHWYTVACGTS